MQCVIQGLCKRELLKIKSDENGFYNSLKYRIIERQKQKHKFKDYFIN